MTPAVSAPSSEPRGQGVDLRLAPLAVGAWAGALAGLNCGTTPDARLMGQSAVTTVSVIIVSALIAVTVASHFASGSSVRMRQRSVTGAAAAGTVAAAIVAFALSALVANVAQANWKRESLSLGNADSESTLVGRVVADPSIASARGGGPGWSVRLLTSGRVELLATVKAEDLNGVSLVRGTLVRIRGRPQIAEPSRPPFWGFLRVEEIEEVKHAGAWQRFVATLKNQLSELSQRIGPAGALVGGMAIGDDRGLSTVTRDAMLTTSLTHLTAISGSHVAISLSVIEALLPGRRVLKSLAVWAFLILVVGVVGPEPAVLRAVGMGSLAAWGLVMKRGGQPLALLFVVTTVTVLVDPWSAVSLGFALSTVATAGILTLGRVGTQWTRGLIADSAIPEWLQPVARATAEAVVIAVVAQAVTLPVLAVISPWLPTWGVVANLLVAPIVTPLTLLGLGTAITCLWWPAGAEVCVTLAAPLARYMEATALRIADWPLAQFPWPQGALGFLLVLALTVIAGIVALNLSRRVGAKRS